MSVLQSKKKGAFKEFISIFISFRVRDDEKLDQNWLRADGRQRDLMKNTGLCIRMWGNPPVLM